MRGMSAVGWGWWSSDGSDPCLSARVIPLSAQKGWENPSHSHSERGGSPDSTFAAGPAGDTLNTQGQGLQQHLHCKKCLTTLPVQPRAWDPWRPPSSAPLEPRIAPQVSISWLCLHQGTKQGRAPAWRQTALLELTDTLPSNAWPWAGDSVCSKQAVQWCPRCFGEAGE